MNHADEVLDDFAIFISPVEKLLTMSDSHPAFLESQRWYKLDIVSIDSGHGNSNGWRKRSTSCRRVSDLGY